MGYDQQSSTAVESSSALCPAFAYDRPATNTAFNKLPIEMNKMIASFIQSDRDLCNFRLICRETYNAIDGDNLSFWRQRFRARFALKPGVTNEKLKRQYQVRHKALLVGVKHEFLDGGYSKIDHAIIAVLRTLIVESYIGGPEVLVCESRFGDPKCIELCVGRFHCLNQAALRGFIEGSKTFLNIKPARAAEPDLMRSSALTATQIMCAQLAYELPRMRYDILPFDDCQRMVYSSWKEHPVFFDTLVNPGLPGDLQVNLDFVLHCMSFWHHHMTKESAGTLFDTMEALSFNDRPMAWDAPLKEGCHALPKHWKGTWACLDQNKLRRLRAGFDETFEDENIEPGDPLEELVIEANPENFVWSPIFESRLRSLIPTMSLASRKTGPDAPPYADIPIRVFGGWPADEPLDSDQVPDDDDPPLLQLTGWLNPLAPQSGISGWQRITLIKHCFFMSSGIAINDLYGFEGVVLPGGKMMFGRWFYASNEAFEESFGDYSGPFVYWAVDDPVPEEEEEKEADAEKKQEEPEKSEQE